MTRSSYHKLSRKIHRAVNDVSNETMQQASQEIIVKSKVVADINDTAISCDGTWQRRGFCSLNGRLVLWTQVVFWISRP